MVNLDRKPGILVVIAQFVCIGVSFNVLCLAFLKQQIPVLGCPVGSESHACFRWRRVLDTLLVSKALQKAKVS